MKIYNPFPTIVLFFIATAPVWSDEPKTFGLKNAKALYDFKKITMPETLVANATIQQLYKAIESGDLENTIYGQLAYLINTSNIFISSAPYTILNEYSEVFALNPPMY